MSETVIFNIVRDGICPPCLYVPEIEGVKVCCAVSTGKYEFTCGATAGHEGPHIAYLSSTSICQIWTDTEQRDQARSIAAKLEAELAVKDALLQRVLSHYRQFYFSNGFDEIAADITAALNVEA